MPDAHDALHEQLSERIGLPMGSGGPSIAPDPVNIPMIRHWVDAFDDRHPQYLDERRPLAPPAMLQTWTMARPRIEGIAARGGSAGTMDPTNPVSALSEAGYRGTLATNSELEFDRYLEVGERLVSTGALEAVSNRKSTGLGNGYFVTWVTTYRTDAGEEVGRQRFRVLKFDPATARPADDRSAKSKPSDADRPSPSAHEALPAFELDVTTTVIVAGAMASRDFMPVHHDRDFARQQGASDIFMNILTSTGYVARYVTDWAGPDSRLTRIAIRLGGPANPGDPLRFSGHVIGSTNVTDGDIAEVSVLAANGLGNHVTGTATVARPSR